MVYLVYDFEENVLALKSFAIEEKDPVKLVSAVRSIYQSDFLLSLLYRKVRVLFDTEHYTLIPSRLYNEQEKESYFEQMVKMEDKASLLADDLRDFRAYLLYPIHQNIFSATKVQFPTAKIGHAISGVLSGCRSFTRETQEIYTFVNVQNRNLQVFVFDKENLLFANTFAFETSKDALYYLLLVFDQFKLKPDLSPVLLSGMIRENSEIYHLFFRYIKNLKFTPAPTNLKLGKQMEQEYLHQYFDIFSSTLLK